MKYKHLDKNYKYDTLAVNLHSREVEFFHYEFDKKNFEFLLSTLEEGKYKKEIEERLASTIEQMNKVESIYNALTQQIDDPVMFEAAVVKAKKERESKVG